MLRISMWNCLYMIPCDSLPLDQEYTIIIIKNSSIWYSWPNILTKFFSPPRLLTRRTAVWCKFRKSLSVSHYIWAPYVQNIFWAFALLPRVIIPVMGILRVSLRISYHGKEVKFGRKDNLFIKKYFEFIGDFPSTYNILIFKDTDNTRLEN